MAIPRKNQWRIRDPHQGPAFPAAEGRRRLASLVDLCVSCGRIAFFDDVVDCSEYQHREHPDATLGGMLKTGRIFGTIEVEGPITANEIRAIALGTMAKITKTDFAAIGK
jgi:hypothetical protein